MRQKKAPKNIEEQKKEGFHQPQVLGGQEEKSTKKKIRMKSSL